VKRLRYFSLILALGFMLIVAGLAYIQIVKYDKFRVMSEENRLKIVPLMAPRGCIYDRSGEVLVKDTLSFQVSVIYSRIENMDSLAEFLSSVLDVPRPETSKIIKKSRQQPYTPTVVASDIGIEKAIHIEEMSMDQPGLLLEVYAKRKYVSDSSMSNVLGYLGLINSAEFERLRHYGYRMDDLVGRDGIEKQYDEYLRGTHGGKQVEVDHRGRRAMTLGFKEPVSGKDIRLTIDHGLQKFCEELLVDKRGAIVVLDPNTGAVLAMASAPAYDPNAFIDQARSGEVSGLLNDREYPLLNRAIAGVYPAGSLFKILIATAALETGTTNKNTTFECPGYYRLGRLTFRCWRKDGHGVQNMQEGIMHSCNVYFFNTGRRLGVDKIAEYAKKFGFGSYTGIDLPGEKTGTAPSRSWKKKQLNDSWYEGDTVNYSIGQGYLLCSPLQIARMLAVFANGGYLVRPYIVKEVEGIPVNNVEKAELGISQDTRDTIREGMRLVVNDPTGTGIKARSKDFTVAGKTGTAQTSRNKTHGWFMGFAPYEEPKVVIVVFDEYGGKGGYYAAETGGKVFKKAHEIGLL